MKTTLTLLALAVFRPLTLPAQSPVPVEKAAPVVAPATTPSAPRIPRVQFNGATLQEMVEFIQARSKEVGQDPDADPLNFVITPGLEEKRVPALSLRNVTPTEVLTVATTILGLRLEPVPGDSGQPVAWLIKGPDSDLGYAGGKSLVGPPPALTAVGGSSGGWAPSGSLGAPRASLAVAPYTVQIAGSPPTTDPFANPSGSQGESRVFGIGSLISSEGGDPKVRQQEQTEKLDRLIRSLEKMAADHGGKTRINVYDEMDILVVKSADQGVLALIAEAIEAMKSNAAKSGNSAQAKDEALRAEMNALRAHLSATQAEKDAQRQALLDQIELLKAAQKAEDSSRVKR